MTTTNLDGLRTRAQSESARHAAAERRANIVMCIIITLTIYAALGLAYLIEGMWTLHIQSILAHPSVIL